MFTFSENYPEEKEAFYDLLCAQLRELIAGERDRTANLANAAALLAGALRDINWAGFYIMSGGGLILGPFQGRPACIRIPLGRGVCGSCALKNEALLVEDVSLFPGHIACDSASRSEIVVPLRFEGAVAAVLDVDSPSPARFDAADRRGLLRFSALLENACDWQEA